MRWEVVNEMDSVGLYILLVAGLIMLPLYIYSRGGPEITRTKALRLLKKDKVIFISILSNFWKLYIINTLISSTALLFTLDKWSKNSIWINLSLILVFILSIIFSGLLVSLPSYVMVKHWRSLQGPN